MINNRLKELANGNLHDFCQAARTAVGQNQHPVSIDAAVVVQLAILNENMLTMIEEIKKLTVKSNDEIPAIGKAVDVIDEAKNDKPNSPEVGAEADVVKKFGKK